MRFVQERAAAVLDFCRHARTMSEIRQHFHEWPNQARYAVHNLVKKGCLVNMVPGAKRGLYLTKSKPPVQRLKPKPTPMNNAARQRRARARLKPPVAVPNSVFTWRPM